MNKMKRAIGNAYFGLVCKRGDYFRARNYFFLVMIVISVDHYD